MALGLSFGGSKGKKKQKGRSETTATKVSKTTQTGTKESLGSQLTSSQQTAQALSTETQGILEKALADIASGSVAGDNLTSFVQDLQTRASESEQSILAQTDAVVQEARRVGEQKIGRQVTQLASATGSSQNSFVQQIGLEAQTGLESQLAALGSEFALKARDTQTQELSQVLQGLQGTVQSDASRAQSLAQLGKILKGATTTVAGESSITSKATEAQTISKLVDELIKSKIKSKGQVSTSGTNFGFTAQSGGK